MKKSLLLCAGVIPLLALIVLGVCRYAFLIYKLFELFLLIQAACFLNLGNRRLV